MNHPRQAIRVNFIGPTERNLNPRFRAKCSAGSLVRECDDDVDHVENAHRTAIALCEKLGWDPAMFVAGGLDNDGYVYVDATETITRATAEAVAGAMRTVELTKEQIRKMRKGGK